MIFLSRESSSLREDLYPQGLWLVRCNYPIDELRQQDRCRLEKKLIIVRDSDNFEKNEKKKLHFPNFCRNWWKTNNDLLTSKKFFTQNVSLILFWIADSFLLLGLMILMMFTFRRRVRFLLTHFLPSEIALNSL